MWLCGSFSKFYPLSPISVFLFNTRILIISNGSLCISMFLVSPCFIFLRSMLSVLLYPVTKYHTNIDKLIDNQ